mgnify:CR=1 FL=1
MALTFTSVANINIQKSGGFRFRVYDITFDSSYATGGWAITPANVGLTNIVDMVSSGPQVAAAGAVFGWDPVNSKLLAYKGAAGMLPEIAAADLNTRVFRFWIIGG